MTNEEVLTQICDAKEIVNFKYEIEYNKNKLLSNMINNITVTRIVNMLIITSTFHIQNCYTRIENFNLDINKIKRLTYSEESSYLFIEYKES